MGRKKEFEKSRYFNEVSGSTRFFLPVPRKEHKTTPVMMSKGIRAQEAPDV